MLDVAGTLDTGGGAFSLGDGDDTFILRGNTTIVGVLDAGAGNDLINANISNGSLARVGSVTGFESLAKSGAGALEIHGSSDFVDLQVQGGLLDMVAGVTLGAHTATVSSGATLNVAGSFRFTPGQDTFTVAGTVTGLGSIDMLDGDDDLTLLDGADLRGLTSLEGGAGTDTLTANIATTAMLGGATGFQTLIKNGGGSVTIAGPAPATFDTVLVHGGLLEIAAGAVVDPQTTVVDAGAMMSVNGTYQGTPGVDTFTLSGALAGTGTVDLLDGDDVLTINTGATVTFDGLFDTSTASADRFVLSGTGAGNFDATRIGNVFRNFDSFSKEGSGTWRLTGTGAQSWVVSEGTLIGSSASLAGDIANAATVIFDQAVDGTYAGVMSGNGTLIKQSAGTLVVAGTHTFTGNTRVTGGTLQVDGVLPGAMQVESGATLSGIGTAGAVAALAGSFVQPGNPTMPFGALTLSGDYVGGATVRISTALDDDGSATSRLVIQGSASGPASPVLINRMGGNGARTTGDGIEVIQVDGASAPDSFHLAQPVQAGAYEYLLYRGGSAAANNWFLRSELLDPQPPVAPVPPVSAEPPAAAFRPAVAGYVLGHEVSLEYGFTALGTLRERIGDQGRIIEEDREDSADGWMRAYASELDMGGQRFEARDLRMYGLHFGGDIHVRDAGEAREHLGMMFNLGESNTTFFDPERAVAGLSTRTGKVEMEMKGAGLYWTRYGAGGSYLDLTAQALHYRNRYRDQFGGASHQMGWGTTVSAEVGSMFKLGRGGWQLEPSLQLGYQRLELERFSDAVSNVSSVNDDALRARATVQVLRAPTDWLGLIEASPYVALGVQHDFRDAAAITLAGTSLRDPVPRTTGDVSAGFTGSVRPGLELHLAMRYQHATSGEKDGVAATFGFRMRF